MRRQTREPVFSKSKKAIREQRPQQLIVVSPKQAFQQVLGLQQKLNTSSRMASTSERQNEIKKKCAQFFHPPILESPQKLKSNLNRSKKVTGISELSFLEKKEIQQIQKWLDFMQIETQREVDELLSEERVPHLSDLPLQAFHKYEEVLHKELKLYQHCVEDVNGLPQIDKKQRVLQRQLQTSQFRAMSGISQSQEKLKRALQMRRAKQMEKINSLNVQISELQTIRHELQNVKEDEKPSRPLSIFSTSEELKINEEMKRMIEECDYSGVNQKLRDIFSQMEEQNPRREDMQGSRGNWTQLLGSDIPFGQLKENISNRLMMMQINTAKILLDKMVKQATVPVQKYVQTMTMDEIAKEAEKKGKVPDFVKRQKYEKLEQEMKRIKAECDHEVAEVKYTNHILREKMEQITIQKKSLVDKEVEMQKKIWSLELQNSTLNVTLKLKREDLAKLKETVKVLEEKDNQHSKILAQHLGKIKNLESSVAYYKQIVELQNQQKKAQEELERKKKEQQQATDTRVVLQTIRSEWTPSSGRGSLMLSDSPSPRAMSVGTTRVDIKQMSPRGLKYASTILKPIQSTAEEQVSDNQLASSKKKKQQQIIMSSQESIDEVLLQSRMKHSDGFKAFHQPGQIKPMDPDAMHPHEYKFGITRSKDQLHQNLTQPVIRRKVAPPYLHFTPGPVMAASVQTEDTLLFQYITMLKSEGLVTQEKGIQTGQRFMIGVPSAGRINQKDERIEAGRRQQAIYNKVGVVLQNARMGADSMRAIRALNQSQIIEQSMQEDSGPEEQEEGKTSGSSNQRTNQNNSRGSSASRNWSNFGVKRGTHPSTVSDLHGLHCEENCEHIQKAKADFWKTTKDLSLRSLKKQLAPEL